jgi:hypothetical protein
LGITAVNPGKKDGHMDFGAWKDSLSPVVGPNRLFRESTIHQKIPTVPDLSLSGLPFEITEQKLLEHLPGVTTQVSTWITRIYVFNEEYRLPSNAASQKTED